MFSIYQCLFTLMHGTSQSGFLCFLLFELEIRSKSTFEFQSFKDYVKVDVRDENLPLCQFVPVWPIDRHLCSSLLLYVIKMYYVFNFDLIRYRCNQTDSLK